MQSSNRRTFLTITGATALATPLAGCMDDDEPAEDPDPEPEPEADPDPDPDDGYVLAEDIERVPIDDVDVDVDGAVDYMDSATNEWEEAIGDARGMDHVGLEFGSNYFDPDILLIDAGTQVTWYADDGGHNIYTPGEGDFNTIMGDDWDEHNDFSINSGEEPFGWRGGLNDGGEEVEMTFDETGTAIIACTVHQPDMNGAIVVV